MSEPTDDRVQALSTRLIHAGRDVARQEGTVNPPIHRGSTILIPRAEDLYSPTGRTYGLGGHQVHEALKTALCELEHARHCLLVESGLLACTLPIFALVGSGEHVLLPDNTYGPTRRYCDRSLARCGGSVTYYQPEVGAGIEQLIQPNTRLIVLESPGSLTFEMPDLRAIIDVAKAKGVSTALDNCWASGVYLKPLDLGVDISILATTKYIGGHSDSLSGAILLNDAALTQKLRDASVDLGLCMSSEDASLVLRGLRTLEVRMARHQESALQIASWLKAHSDVLEVLHPGLPGAPGHELWKRDFAGSSGLFAFVLRPSSERAVIAFLNALTLFGLGFSYGGYESLAIHGDPQLVRRERPPDLGGPLVRLAVGLEDPNDLIADLERGFAAWAELGPSEG